MLEHMSARSRWRDNLSACPFKYSNGMFRDRAGFHSQSRVEVGLSAAGLIGSEINVYTQAAENIHDSLTRLWVERIDKTGDEELDRDHKSIVIRIIYLLLSSK